MKVPSWFLLGCGLLLLNALAVLGGALTRHAVAEPPVQALQTDKSAENETATADLPEDSPEVSSTNEAWFTRSATGATNPSQPALPQVPSLEDLPPTTNTAVPSILGVEDFKKVFSEQTTGMDAPVPPSEIPTASSAISDQLSHSYFEALQLRLKSVTHLSQASQGLVAEATILFQRGEVREAKELLGMATQLRETAAKLLVTRQ